MDTGGANNYAHMSSNRSLLTDHPKVGLDESILNFGYASRT